MLKKARHFKNKESYLRWVAYGNIHKVFDAPGNQEVFIAGKRHKVKHKRK